ncbi:MAG: lipase [Leptospiraceae bacterium]|nr:lipase [Leptospiraceae bacterium]MCP5493464.1 lipase [Leptospiraceae bacterium]
MIVTILKKFVFFLLFLAFVLIGTELSLRFLKPKTLQYYRDVKILHGYHPEYGITLAPNVDIYVRHYADLWEGKFTTNSLGHRGTPEPVPNKPKIACLGDSIVMGFGVSDEDTFCRLLDGTVIKGEPRQSINLGVDAYGSMGSAKRLMEMAPKLPNLKEVLFFVSPNDFTIPESLREQGVLPDDETDALRENDKEFKRNFYIQFELTRISYLLQALKLAWEQLSLQLIGAFLSMQKELQLMGILHSEEVGDANIFSYFVSSFFHPPPKSVCMNGQLQNTKAKPSPQNMSQEDYKAMYCPEPVPNSYKCEDSPPSSDKDLPPLPEITIRAYNLMIETAKKYNFELIIVFLPIQIEEIYCYTNGKYHPLGDYAIRAGAFFKKHSIRIIDILPYTKEMCGNKIKLPSGQEKYSGIKDYSIPGDGHLTEIGNKWLTRALKRELE